MTPIAERIKSVRQRIAAAAERAGRSPDGVRLVAVTKEVPPERVREAIEAGVTDVGENRVQEMERKMISLGDAGPATRWHFIGTLQRNKVARVSGRVDLIHGVDSVGLGRAIGLHAPAGSTQDVLVEVNTSGEPTKHGFAPGDVAGAVRELSEAAGLRIRGLMSIAPEGDEAAARACFRALRALRDELGGEPGAEGLEELSMGMSGDFEVAIEEGATVVRVGTAIFGPRG